MTDRKNDGLVVWTLSYLRPYRKRVALLALLLVSEIGLGTLQPWPLAVVIDFLSARPLPEPLTRVAPWIAPLAAYNKFAFLIAIVIAGVVLQVINQFVSAYGTQVQVDTGQRMVYDLRARLFEHLTALGLHHHLTTSTADAVYRVDVDAYAIENLVMSGFFPLATSITSLSVMFWILLRLNVVISYLGAVYGPLSAIAHTTGQLQGALAGTRRVRAMFALMPETVDAPDAIGADAVKGVIRVEGVGFTYPNGKRVLHDISFL